MKYKAEEKIVLRSDLDIDGVYGGVYFVSKMNVFKGSVVTIKTVKEKDKFSIVEDGEKWNYSTEMIDEKATRRLNGDWLSICEIDWTEGAKYIDSVEGLKWEVRDGDLFMLKNGVKLSYMRMQYTSKMRFKKLETDWSKVAVDTKIWVSNDKVKWQKAHFAGYHKEKVVAFPYGKSDWTCGVDLLKKWNYAKLAEEEEQNEKRPVF